jgi:hypothetical protein
LLNVIFKPNDNGGDGVFGHFAVVAGIRIIRLDGFRGGAAGIGIGGRGTTRRRGRLIVGRQIIWGNLRWPKYTT